MREQKPTALIAAGRMGESTLEMLPGLAQEVTLVIAGSKRLASRYVNAIRAGRPTEGFDDLHDVKMIWLQVPPEQTGVFVKRLAGLPLEWEGRTVVLFSRDQDSSELRILEQRGAAVASISEASEIQAETILAEGSAQALKQLRPILRKCHLRVLEIERGRKALYNAGLMVAVQLSAPLMEAALRSLRGAGLDQLTAKRILRRSLDSALRAHEANGKKAWVNPVAGGRNEVVRNVLSAVDAADPELAWYLNGLLAGSLRFFGQPGDWPSPEPAA
jgi:hypothetical protein